MSEEDQLKLALELSIQGIGSISFLLLMNEHMYTHTHTHTHSLTHTESLPEEALLDASVPPSSPTPVTGTPTKETVDQHNRTISPEPGNIEVHV